MRSRIFSNIRKAILVWVTFVRSKQSRQLVRNTPFCSYMIFPVFLSSMKYKNFLTRMSSILIMRSFNLWKFYVWSKSALTYISFSLCVKVIVSILDAFRLTYLQQLFQSLGKHVLIASGFLQQVNEYHQSIVIDHVT